MATLTQAQLDALAKEFARQSSSERLLLLITKQELRAAFYNTDAWVDANAGPFNQSIPEPARSSMTAKDKVRMFSLIVEQRWKVT